jgi:hypothetical protein
MRAADCRYVLAKPGYHVEKWIPFRCVTLTGSR